MICLKQIREIIYWQKQMFSNIYKYGSFNKFCDTDTSFDVLVSKQVFVFCSFHKILYQIFKTCGNHVGLVKEFQQLITSGTTCPH